MRERECLPAPWRIRWRHAIISRRARSLGGDVPVGAVESCVGGTPVRDAAPPVYAAAVSDAASERSTAYDAHPVVNIVCGRLELSCCAGALLGASRRAPLLTNDPLCKDEPALLRTGVAHVKGQG